MKKQTTGDKKVIKEMHDFLLRHDKMVLTVINTEGKPSSTLVHYIIDNDFNFYFGTRKSFCKYEALQNNSNVSAAVVLKEDNPTQIVELQGVAYERDSEKIDEHLKTFVFKNNSKYYIRESDDLVMYCIVPDRLRFHDASDSELKVHNIDFSLL